tara:strand:- start:4386 stop:6641 length:2256 start_codon:yes stop_codon:yes gene_type:complete
MPDDELGSFSADPKVKVKQRAFRLPMAWSLILAFALITLAVFSAIIYFNHYHNAALTYGYTAKAISDVAQRIKVRVDGTLRPALALAADAEDLVWSASGEPFGPEARRFVAGFMEVNPQVSSVYFAVGDTDFIQIYNVVPGETIDWGKVAVPAGTRFVVRHLRGPADQARDETWTFLDAAKRPFGEPVHRMQRYDPRTRPWYKAVAKGDAVELSMPYAFATLNTVGITASKRVDSGVGGVFGVDMTLSGLSRVLEDLDIAGKGSAIAFTRDGMVIAHPDKRKIVIRDADGTLRPAQVKDLDDPVAEAMFDAARIGARLVARVQSMDAFIGAKPLAFLDGQPDLISFDVGETPFVSHVVRLDTQIGTDAFLGIALLRAEVLKGVAGLTFNSLALSLLFLLGGTLLIVLVARNMARPIADLARETDIIRRLELGAPLTIRSRVAEVQDLAAAIGSLKTTLQGLGRYIPRGVVHNLIKEGKLPELGGQSRQVTVMFTDAVGFTKLGELMTPQDLMRKLSSYFEVLSAEVLAEGGNIDKYIGDAVMAVWNGVEDDPEHTVRACRAALKCAAENDRLNDMWRSYKWPEIHTRFGLHQGEAVVGNIGSRTRMDHTTIGACVNTASRLEGLNKAYGTRILISDVVRDKVADRFLTRPIDRVCPAGSTQPIMVYELLGALDGDDTIAASPEAHRRCVRWAEIYDAYLARDWAGVGSLIDAFLADFPDDGVALVYRERARRYASAPPADDWDGVEISDQK